MHQEMSIIPLAFFFAFYSNFYCLFSIFTAFVRNSTNQIVNIATVIKLF